LAQREPIIPNLYIHSGVVIKGGIVVLQHWSLSRRTITEKTFPKFHTNEKKKKKIDSPIWSTNVLLKYNIISKITIVTLRLYIPDVD
jgi:hypothetical protein